MTENTAMDDVWKRVATSKATSSLISALVHFPGLTATARDISTAQTRLYDAHHEISDALAAHFRAGSELKGNIEALVSVALADVRVQRAGELEEQDIAKLGKLLQGSIEMSTPTPQSVFDETFPRTTAESLAEAKAAARGITVLARIAEKKPVTQKLFLGKKSPEESAERIKEFLKQSAREISESIVPLGCSSKDRSLTYMSTLGCLETMFSASMYRRYEEMTSRFRDLNGTLEGKRELRGILDGIDNGTCSMMDLVEGAIADTGIAINLDYPDVAKSFKDEMMDSEEAIAPR